MSTPTLRRVSAEEAHALQVDGHTIVDVRTEAEYAMGHPAAAYNVPYMLRGQGGMRPNERFMEVMTRLFGSDAKLLVSCQSGIRSARAARQLIAAGFTTAIDVEPGFGGVRNPFGQVTAVGWRDAGLPTELETPGRSYQELLAPPPLAAD